MKWQVVIAAAIFLHFVVDSRSQERCTSSVERSVVMLDVASSDGRQYGAGVIFSIRGGDIYIATAAHVVTTDQRHINVNFLTDRGRVYTAKIEKISSTLDMAYVLVQNPDLAESLSRQLDWRLLVPKTGGASPNYAIIVGNNGGSQWSKPLAPERIISYEPDQIVVDSRATRPGASGGGVFDPNDELLGMIYSDTYGQAAQAFPMQRVLQEARRLGLPVDLTENHLAVPAVSVSPLRGGPGGWGEQVAGAIRAELGQSRRVIDCQNDEAISVVGGVSFQSPSLTTDVAAITWRFTGATGVAPETITQYIEFNRLPWGHVSNDSQALAGKTKEAADFAVRAVTSYLAK